MPSAAARYQPGIYYQLPNSNEHTASLVRLNGSSSLQRTPGNGFDIRKDLMVFGDPDGIILVKPDGTSRRLATGLFYIDRPSFSPDGKKIAVQASSTYSEGPIPNGLGIFVVDLQTGTTEKISTLDYNQENPVWFPHQNKIAYGSYSPTVGIRIHIYDYDAKKEIIQFDQKAFHQAVSPDGKLLFNTLMARLYYSENGTQIADLKTKIIQGIGKLGYVVDTRYPGQANLGTLSLSSVFSQDGKNILFDGAVEKNGRYGIVVFNMTIQSGELTAMTGLIADNPDYTNKHNYSPLYLHRVE